MKIPLVWLYSSKWEYVQGRKKTEGQGSGMLKASLSFGCIFSFHLINIHSCYNIHRNWDGLKSIFQHVYSIIFIWMFTAWKLELKFWAWIWPTVKVGKREVKEQGEHTRVFLCCLCQRSSGIERRFKKQNKTKQTRMDKKGHQQDRELHRNETDGAMRWKEEKKIFFAIVFIEL